MGNCYDFFLEKQNQIFADDNAYICASCIGNEDAKKYFNFRKDIIEENVCHFCEKTKKCIQVSHILKGLSHFIEEKYSEENPSSYNKGIACFDEGNLLIDILNDYLQDNYNESFIDYIINLVNNNFMLYESEENIDLLSYINYKNEWKLFLEKIKNKPSSDYFFKFLNFIKDLKLFVELNHGNIIFRAREGQYEKASDLGPPPAEVNGVNNRFSSPDKRFFYGSKFKKYTLDEINTKKNVTIGKWEVNKKLKLINFRNLDKYEIFKNKCIIFDENLQEHMHFYNFFRYFLSYINKPKTPNIDAKDFYYPMQNITHLIQEEYFKLFNNTIDGFAYSRDNSKNVNYVLFCDSVRCINKGEKLNDSWLTLKEVSYIK